MSSPDEFPDNNYQSPRYSPRLGELRDALENAEEEGATPPYNPSSEEDVDPLGTPCPKRKRPWFLEPLYTSGTTPPSQEKEEEHDAVREHDRTP